MITITIAIPDIVSDSALAVRAFPDDPDAWAAYIIGVLTGWCETEFGPYEAKAFAQENLSRLGVTARSRFGADTHQLLPPHQH